MLASAALLLVGMLLPQREGFGLLGLLLGSRADSLGLLPYAILSFVLALLILGVAAAALWRRQRAWGALMFCLIIAQTWAADKVVKAYAGDEQNTIWAFLLFAGMLGLLIGSIAYLIKPRP